MTHEFKMFVRRGLEKEEIQCDGVSVIDENGNEIELRPRRSDGDIVLYAEGSLIIIPRAGNCATVMSRRRPKL